MMEIKLSTRKKLLIISICLLFVAIAGTILFLSSQKKNKSLVSPLPSIGFLSPEKENPPETPAAHIPNKKTYTVLLLGQGDPSHEGSQLTDSLVVIHFNANTKKAALISLPRDIWANGKKINAIYAQGGFSQIKEIVKQITGLPIDNAILIDFNAFAQAIDSIGGIEVNVEKPFDDYFYPIKGKELDNCGKTPEELAAINATLSGFLLEKQYTCRYEHIHFDKGKTKMDGATALKFVRSRHSDNDGNDFSRGERQQLVLLAVKDKLLSLNVFENLLPFFEKMSQLIKTDLNEQIIKSLPDLISDPRSYEIIRLGLSEANVLSSAKGKNGQFILLPKAGEDQWEETKKFIEINLAGSGV